MGVHDTGIVGASSARPAVTSIEFAENQCESEEPAARTAKGRPYIFYSCHFPCQSPETGVQYEKHILGEIV